MTFDQVIELDDRVFAVIESDATVMYEKIGATPFPHTYRALFGFCVKINVLKTAMFDMIESDNPYVFKALYRCYCEHYLKFMYLFTRFVKEHSDAVGTEYFAYCGAAETREYVNAFVTMEGLLGNAVVADAKAFIQDRYPDAAHLSNNQLEDASAQFKYRAILRFLAREVGIVGPKMPFLARMIPVYAEFSSFVHGGPSGDLDMASYHSAEALEKCKNEMEIIVLLAATVTRFTAIAVARDFRDVLPLEGKLSAAMKEDAPREDGPTEPTESGDLFNEG